MAFDNIWSDSATRSKTGEGKRQRILALRHQTETHRGEQLDTRSSRDQRTIARVSRAPETHTHLGPGPLDV